MSNSTTQAGAAATAADLVVTGLERRHQIATRPEDPGQFAEGSRPIGRREVHEGVPADHPRQRGGLDGQVTQVGNVEGEVGMVTAGHPDHLW